MLFIHGLPDRHGHSAWKYEQQRAKKPEAFREVASISAEDYEAIVTRITVVGSDDYFCMESLKDVLAPVGGRDKV